MSNYHYNKNNVLIKNHRKYHKIIPLLIKLNIVKYTIIKQNTLIIYLQTNKLTKTITFSKKSKSIFLNLQEIIKLNGKKNCIFLLSSNNGIITNTCAIKKKIGGQLLFGIIQ